jgi:hypothetical protein
MNIPVDTNQTEGQDILKTMFGQLPEEALSPAFLPAMMQRIQAESVRMRKRNERLRIVGLAAASAAIAGLAVAILVYIDMPQIRIDFSSISFPPVYLYIGALTLILLLADSLFRQRYFRKHPERYGDSRG